MFSVIGRPIVLIEMLDIAKHLKAQVETAMRILVDVPDFET